MRLVSRTGWRRAGSAIGIAIGLLAAPAGSGAPEAGGSGRRVAVTFDDLPGPPAGLLANDPAALRRNTRKLLATFRRYQIPVVGFVNEGKLFVEGEPPSGAEDRTAILKMWVDDGLELGNHTYAHRSLNTTPLEEFEADVVRGEPVTRRLQAERGRPLRYFRHPFLQVGLELDKRQAFEAWLAEHGYTIAPVTIDNDEYMYAAVYADALRRGDRAAAKKASEDYRRYMDSVVTFIEEVSRRLAGREIAQILLLHANTLNADHFASLARSLRDRGYQFITLEEALRDGVYRLPDSYVGRWGISWLHHWELTAGLPRSPSPDPPAWLVEAYEALNR